jgi:hypothetical protein
MGRGRVKNDAKNGKLTLGKEDVTLEIILRDRVKNYLDLV